MGLLSQLAVRYRVTFSMIFLIVIGSGLFFLRNLALDMYPDLTFPVMGVITTYSGASPEDVEELLTRPIEEACTAVEGVKHVNSESRAGASLVFVEFEWGTNLDQAEIDVRRNIEFFRERLPDDAESPLTFLFDPSMQPVLIYGFSGPYDQATLKRISTRELEPLLERIPGVAQAETLGGLDREIHVEVLPERLTALGISVSQVVGALRRENVTIPGGEVARGARSLAIQTHGTFQTVADIGEIVVGVAGGVPVLLRDVAEVKDTVAETNRVIRVNKRSAIMLMIRKQSGSNTVQSVRAVTDALPEIMTRLPDGVELQPIFNQADFINDSLGNLSNSAFLAIGITILVLFFFLRSIGASLMVGLAIPVSGLITFTVMYFAHMTLNIISLAGLALAVGMLVDNSIVVLENIYRHLELGASPIRAAIDGAAEVTAAIVGSTLTTVAVFLPILFVPGLAGAMFRDMALTICISLGASIFVALTLIPMCVAVFQMRGVEVEQSKLARLYVRAQEKALAHPVLTVVLAVLALIVGVGFVAINYLNGHSDFLPQEDRGMVFFQLRAQVGSNVEHIDELARQSEDLIFDHVKEKELYSTDVGMGEGFAAIFTEGKHAGLARVRLVPLNQRSRKQWQIEEQVRELLGTIPGLDAQVFKPFMMGGDQSDIVIKLFGHDLEIARRIGKEVESTVAALPGAKDVAFGLAQASPELNVDYDRKKMARLGLSSADLTATVSSFFQGTIASIYREGGQDYNIRVRSPRWFRNDPSNLANLAVVSPVAGQLPLRGVATLREGAGPVKITREDQQRVVQVTANVLPGQLGKVTAAIEETLGKYPFPEGFNYKVGGSAEDMKESFFFLGLAFLASILLVYMVMAAVFESLLTPFVIALTIPLGMTGVGAALFFTGTSLSVTAIIGIVLLVGVVVNNSIVLVDYANQQVAKGLSRAEAVALAGRLR
ncbi:MAG: efflux RND transporter permease subunit, partial [Myxococcota bacterium]|nr:efflux RND transporter permease subunit [Myxococcota bacterium]